jgi:guanine nucleotide-binding protein subunit alpha
VLLYGPSGSGKATFMKQMKLLFVGMTHEERLSYVPHIRDTTFRCLTTLIKVALALDIPVDPQNTEPIERIIETKSKIQYNIDEVWSHDLCNDIHALSSDSGLLRAFGRGENHHLSISTLYFLKNVLRYADTNFVPTNDDIIRCNSRNNFVDELILWFYNEEIHFIDVSAQQNERKKWIHQFEIVDFVMLVFYLVDRLH